MSLRVMVFFICAGALGSLGYKLYKEKQNPVVGIVNGQSIHLTDLQDYVGTKDIRQEDLKKAFDSMAEEISLVDQAKRVHQDVKEIMKYFERVREFEITDQERDGKYKELGLDKNLGITAEIEEMIYFDRLQRARQKYKDEAKNRSTIKYLVEESQ